MPRRGIEIAPFGEPPRKKSKVLFKIPSSLDISFQDDEALPPGIVFTDVQQKQWKIGKPIGRGSFGRIYLASDDVESEVTKHNAKYVVKIEPYSNGPLFVEIHCLIRTAQCAKIKAWRQQKKLHRLGMPVYISSGSFTENKTEQKYRFLIVPRYDIDLQKVIARTKVLDLKNVCVLAIQILDVLEYLHSQGYTHSDIKSSNLMIGFECNKYAKPFKTPSFQKETKELLVLSGKQRKPKPGKARTSNYYTDEDFKIKDYQSGFNIPTDEEKDRKLANNKNKFIKIMSEKEARKLHRHHAFNLRQISNYVNYEDISSSVCSDQSYQRLLDGYESIHKVSNSSDEGFHDDPKLPRTVDLGSNHKIDLTDIYQEAILSQSRGHIYLLDYGLASKFLDSEGNHKDFGMDARKAHDGTLEYSSRDSHIGAHSRRSDLETLGFNLIDWLTGMLPWKNSEMLANPDLVHEIKKNCMNNVQCLLTTSFKTEYYPQFMETYLKYVTSLEFTDKPDYDFCRNIFMNALTKVGCTNKEPLLNFSELSMNNINRNKLLYAKRFSKKFTVANNNRMEVNKSYERENIHPLENDLMIIQTPNNLIGGVRKPCASKNYSTSLTDLVARLQTVIRPHKNVKKSSPKNLRSKQNKRGKEPDKKNIGEFGNFMGSSRQFTWAEVLAGNPEILLRKERNTAANTDDEDEENCKYRIRKISDASDSSDSNIHSPIVQKDYLQDKNPTYAMKEVIAKLKNKISGKEENVCSIDGYTPAMMRVLKIKEKNEIKEKQELHKLENKITNDTEQIKSTRKNKTKRTTVKKSDTESTSSNDSVKCNKSSKKSAKSKIKSIDLKNIDTENISSNDSVGCTKSSRKNTKSKIKSMDLESVASNVCVILTRTSKRSTKATEVLIKNKTRDVKKTKKNTKLTKKNKATEVKDIKKNTKLSMDTESVASNDSTKCTRHSNRSTKTTGKKSSINTESIASNDSTKCTRHSNRSTKTSGRKLSMDTESVASNYSTKCTRHSNRSTKTPGRKLSKDTESVASNYSTKCTRHSNRSTKTSGRILSMDTESVASNDTTKCTRHSNRSTKTRQNIDKKKKQENKNSKNNKTKVAAKSKEKNNTIKNTQDKESKVTVAVTRGKKQTESKKAGKVSFTVNRIRLRSSKRNVK